MLRGGVKWALPQEGDMLESCSSERHSEREPLTRTLIKRKGDAEQLALSHIADGKAEWSSHFGNNLAVSQKVKHTVSIQPSNPTPRNSPSREIIFTFPQKRGCGCL